VRPTLPRSAARFRSAATVRAAATVASLALCACVNDPGLAGGITCDASGSEVRDAELIPPTGPGRDEPTAGEVDRLRAELRQAEEVMAAIESGRGSAHNRADATSALADARMAIERASQRAPWLEEDMDAARTKLADAELQLQAGNVASATFFAQRARRLAETAREDGERLAGLPGAQFVQAKQAELRAAPSIEADVLVLLAEATPVLPERREGGWALVQAPSGTVGWVRQSLLRAR
jgi:hypothetical protein